jgi:DNA-binding transcriptional ArsR family regulator
MVNYHERLDRTFAALGDPTRRAILARLEREIWRGRLRSSCRR